MNEKKIEELLKEKKIHEIINDKINQIHPDVSLKEAVRQMQTTRSRYVVLAENREVRGIFTEWDLVQKVLGKSVDYERPVREFMSPDPLVLSPGDAVGTAIDLMAKKKYYHVPLVDESGKLAGMLSVRTLVRFLAAYYPTEVYNLPPDPGQVSDSAEGG